MSKGINKVILIGNLGMDPESVGPAVKLKLATSESWKDKSGQTSERTEWHTVTMFGRLGEIAQQYLAKGSKVYIEGSLRTNKYTGKDGVERYSTEVIASNMQMLGGKNDEPSAPRAAKDAQPYDYMATMHPAATGKFEDDSDLPF